MDDSALTPEKILNVTEAVLRRFGPGKASVVDIARALGVSHGSLYRHFPSKADLFDAVVARWLGRVAGPLALIAAEAGPAPERLRRWFDVLIASERAKAQGDPELFATYAALAADARKIVAAHSERLATHIAKIVDDGVKQGAFAVGDANAMGAAIFDATTRFHHPLHARDWSSPEIAPAFEAIWRLILGGLGACALK
ncbi:TetR family transcriptional regulator [Methylocapsa aurea]|uniref:TetR family transcriptional regulator n=1 Tax=Methylocapsa aurea TaxID=663610 RepID=UPI0005669DB4|nr:TetR family transcriptional regulator [Methylocapsa aurea]